MEPLGLLISRDLFFNSKITGTAQALGKRVLVAGTRTAVLARIESDSPKAVFVDLAAGDAASAESIAAYRAIAPEIPMIAFGSHVDTDSLATAKSAGCDEVMPRSKFTMVLPDLIQRYLA
jgi:DNA-binding NarL/FixJ family response regulator